MIVPIFVVERLATIAGDTAEQRRAGRQEQVSRDDSSETPLRYGARLPSSPMAARPLRW